jgi:hypothetical protein
MSVNSQVVSAIPLLPRLSDKLFDSDHRGPEASETATRIMISSLALSKLVSPIRIVQQPDEAGT